MRKYEKPEMKIVAFDATDIVMTSTPEQLAQNGASLGELDAGEINLFA